MEGQIAVTRPGAASMLVNQASPRGILNWQDFSIGAQEWVKFIQPGPGSVILNRVVGNNPSEIFGRMTANGQVFLTNSNGVLFGRNASIDVGGLVASTLAISNQDFMAGQYRFAREGAAGSIQNLGRITAADAGFVALLAPEVRNEGAISARLGTVALGAGERVSLKMSDGSLLGLNVEQAAVNALAENRNLVQADGGRVILSARAADQLVRAVVNNEGIIEARSVSAANGVIRLEGGPKGRVAVSGTLDASGPAHGASGGRVEVLAGEIAVTGPARIDASGDQGGGIVLIGGDHRGANPDIPNARLVSIDAAATINADAHTQGDGGRVIVWSDEHTRFDGSISARGGNLGGNGGFVETSGALLEIGDGAVVSTIAPRGASGTWLLDPNDFTIAASGGNISGATLSTNLGGGNITIDTATQGSAGNGDIFVNDGVSWSSNSILTLSAQRNINVNAVIAASGNTAGITLTPNTGALDGSYSLGAGGRIDLTGASPSLSIASQSYTVLNSLGVAGDAGTTTLQGMKNGLTGRYALGSNIDASATSGWNSGAGFAPVGVDAARFTGTFDGLGHTITGLIINRGSTDHIGLFGHTGTGSILKNVGLLNVNMTGRYGVGGLAGSNLSTISNSYTTGTVLSTDYGVGGLVGRNFKTITNSYSTANVTGSNVGGLVGIQGSTVDSGSITNSHATGNVTGTANYTGGLVGYNYETNTINNSYSTGAVSGVNYVGGLVGGNYGPISNSYSTGSVSGSSSAGGLVGIAGGGTVTNSYWDTETSGQATSFAGTGKTSAQLMTQSTYSGWDFTNTWWMADGSTRPFLRSEWSTSIGNAHQLQLMAMNLGATYTLQSDIDLGPALAAVNGKYPGMWGAAGFAPVGSNAAKFAGTFDGLNHTIGGLTINTPSSPNVGLFGAIGAGAAVRNVGLTGGSITGLYNVGALAGQNDGGTISNAYAQSAVAATGTENIGIPGLPSAMTKAGGLVGLNTNGGTVTTSYATGNVSGTRAVGGLVGLNIGGSSVSFSHATGNVTGTQMIGGLVGVNDYQSANTISDTYATGNVTGENSVGGLAGWNGWTVDRSYATGSVTGTVDGVGGLLGYNRFQSVTNSYATGAVTGGSAVGGLIGVAESGPVQNSYATGAVTGSATLGGLVAAVGPSGIPAAVSNSFWDITTTGQSSSVGGGTGKTSAELMSQSTYGGWDFTNTWWMADGSTRPFLRNEWSTTIGNTHQLQLMAMNLGAIYTLTSDIDLGPALAAASGKYPGMWGAAGFAPVGSLATQFTGQFDGFNHTITGLSINRPTTDYVGLFGYANGATIGNVGLVGGSVTGQDAVGGLAGQNYTSTSTVTNSYSTGAVTGREYVGGLVGYSEGTITNSYSTGTVSASRTYVGGLVGWKTAGGITNTYATGAVSGGSDSNAGGLVGVNSGGAITNSHSEGAVSAGGNSNVGGLVGQNTSGGTIDTSYSTGTVSSSGAVSSVGGLVGGNGGGIANSYSTGAVSASGSFVGGLVGWINGGGTVTNSYSTGAVSSGGGGLVGSIGTGSVANSFWDTETSGLSSSAGGAGATGKTTAQLMTQSTYGGWDFTNTWWMADGNTRPFLRSEWSTTITNAHQLQMMGMNLSASYTLANNIDLSGSLAAVNGKYPGMWGSAGFVPVGNSGAKFTGTLDGLNHTIGNLFINRPGTSYVGLFGYADTGSAISNVGLVNANVTGGVFVGALIGENWTGASVNNAYSTGSVVSVASSPNSIVGGLVGRNTGAISNSYSTASATGNYDNAGGLVGINSIDTSPGTISNSYSTGRVHGFWNVGGLAGTNYGTITNSFSTGYPTQSGFNIGGLVGNSIGGTVSNSYWDTETSGRGTSQGGTGLITALMMQSGNFGGFDFPGTWNIVPSISYPYLRWQFSSTPQIVSGTVTGSGGNGTRIQLIANGANLAAVTRAGANGFYYAALPGNSVPDGSTAVSYVTADAYKGATALGSAGSHLTGMNITQSTLTIGGGNVSNSGLGTAKGSLTSSDIPYSVSGGNLSVSSGFAFQTLSGASYTLDGSVTTVNTAQTWGGPVTLTSNATLAAGSGAISIDGAISGAGRNLTLNSTGNVTQSAGISVAGLELLGTGGNYQLTNTGNAIDTLAGNTGTVNFLENSGFAIGTVNTAGLTTSGNIILNATGGVTQTAPITAQGLQLLGAGGSYTLTDPANTISTLAGNTGSISFTNSGSFTVATTHVAKFAYAANNGSSNVSVYSIDQATGALTPVGTFGAGTNPLSVTVDPTGRFAFSANISSNDVSAFTIDQTTGALAPVGTAPAANAHSVTVDPTGRFLYAGNRWGTEVSVFTINQTTGALTAGTAVTAGTWPVSVVVDPTGKFAYAVNYASENVSAFTINQTTGALSAAGTIGVGTTPRWGTVDPTGRFFYVSNGNSNSISVYTINRTTGALTAAGPAPAGSNPEGITVDPRGKFLYAANNQSNNISVFTIDQTTGALTPGTAVGAGTYPTSVSVDPTGKFAYVSNQNSNSVSVYAIDQATGALTAGAPVAAGTNPYSVAAANVNGGVAGITATGDVTLVAGGSGTITVTNSLFKQGAAAATFTLQANHSIVFNTSADIGLIGGGSNAINVVLNSDRDASGAGNIQLNAGTIVSSNGGNITLGGGAPASGLPSAAAVGTGTAAASDRAGIYLNLATLDAGAGNISLRGTGVAGGESAYGIHAVDGGRIESTSGTVSLTGTGGAGTNDNYGVHLVGAGTMVSSGSGSIHITGQAAGSTWVNIGTYLLDGAVVSSGSGPITINGTGSAGQDWNIGVVLGGADTKVSSVTGPIAITGQGGAGSAGNNYGIHVNNGAAVASTGSATITLDGRGAGGDAGILTTHIGAHNFDGSNVTIGGVSSTGNITLTSDTATGADSISLADLAISGTGNLYLQPRSAASTVGIAGGAGTFNLSSAELDKIQSGFAGITIGRSDSTGAIDLGAYNWRDALTLRNPGSGGIAIGGTTDLGGRNLTLSSGGAISQTAAITNVNRLTLSAGGAIDLDVSGVSNTVATLGNVSRGGAFELADSAGGLTLDGTVGAHSSDATIRTGGNLTLNAGSSVSVGGTGNIALAADGGNFTNNAGSTPFALGTGRWLVYSSDPANDTQGGLAAGNAKPNLYNRTFASTPPSNISQAGNHSVYSYQPALSVTADDASRVYGDANPTLSATISGLANGDSASDAYSGSAAVSTAAATTSAVSGSPYTITAAAGTLASDIGYSFSFGNGALTITKAPLTLTADDKTREYGDANPSLSATLSGFKNGEVLATSGVSGAASLSTGANATTAVGNASISTAAGTLAAGNYNFSVFNNGTLTITKAPLTVTTDDKMREYGDANPSLTATLSGFKNSETLATSGVSGSAGLTTAANGSTPVGAATIAATAGNLSAGNYDFTVFNNGTLTITKAPLTVTADDKTREYGDANPALSATLSGFKNGETLATSGVSGSAGLTAGANGSTPVGAATIVAAAGNLSAGNYNFSVFNNGTLSITKAPLTVTADDKAREYGDANPSLTATLSGFKNAETLATSGMSGSAGLTAGANGSTPVGAATIVAAAGNLSAGNYNFSVFNNGTLAITKAPLSVTADDKTREYGDANPALTATLSGFKNGETLATSGVSGSAGLTAGANGSTPVGAATIVAAAGNLSAGNYNFSVFNNGTLSITKAPLTVTADDKAREYGDANPSLTATLSGFKNAETLATSGVSGSASLFSSAAGSTPVGNATISAAAGTLAAGNYEFSVFNNGTLAITKAPLSVTADDKSRLYGGANPELTASFGGFKNGETPATSGVSGSASLATGANGSTPVGAATIVAAAGNLSAGNYNFTVFNNGTLTIAPAPLAIRADDQGKVYGDPDPALTASFSGLVNGETSSVVSGLALAAPTGAAAGAGNHAISVSGASASNYAITQIPGTLTVARAPLGITADDKSKTYGAADPTLTASYSGFQYGENSSVVAGLTLSAPAGAAATAGNHAITPSGASANNYAITEIPGTLTASPASLTIAADDKSRTYGAANPALTASATGLAYSDSASLVTGLTTTAAIASSVGGYPIDASAASAGPNYVIGGFTHGTLTVNKAPLTVQADDKAKTYGGADPALSASYLGLVAGDTSAVVTGVSLAAPTGTAATAGTHAIAASGGAATNYDITRVNGVLTVNKAALSLTADDKSKTYGATDPALSASYSGFVYGEDASIVSGLILLAPTGTAATAGTHAIAASGGAATNYDITRVNGVLTVNKAPLSLTADDKSKTYGAADPALSASYAGFVYGEDASIVSGLILLAPTGAAATAGTHAISASGAVSPNYAITALNGTLAVARAPLSITADDQSKTYGAQNPPLTATLSGFKYSDTGAVAAGLTLATPVTLETDPGTYPITASGANPLNYSVIYRPGLFSVAKAPLTITVADATRAEGAADPIFTVSDLGYVLGHNIGELSGTLEFGTGATRTSPPGKYAITASGFTSDDYEIRYRAGELTVTPSIRQFAPMPNPAIPEAYTAVTAHLERVPVAEPSALPPPVRADEDARERRKRAFPILGTFVQTVGGAFALRPLIDLSAGGVNLPPGLGSREQR